MPPVGTRGRYSVGGRNAATSATIGNCVATLWNPHATKDIYVVRFSMAGVSSDGKIELRPSTARGTPGSTVTPGIDNDAELLLAPISGALLDLAAYSVEPTLQSPARWRYAYGGNVAGGMAQIPLDNGVRVPAGTGVSLILLNNAADIKDLTFEWDE